MVLNVQYLRFLMYKSEPRDRECTESIVKSDWGTSQKTSEQLAEHNQNWGKCNVNDVIFLVQITASVQSPKKSKQ